jgi:glucose-6-phosphate 1-epimerase
MDIRMTEWGSLPAVQLELADGSRAVVTLYGAHLVSWQTADGRERLFCSAKSAMDGSRAIRGGVPVIFPQFAERGQGMRHGFARVCTWRVAGGETGNVTLTLANADLPAAMAAAWPHAFALTLKVALHRNALDMVLAVENTGTSPLNFASALHTYYLVDDLARARIHGVQNEVLAINDKFDHVFESIKGTPGLECGDMSLTMAQQGFTDAVVWNPGAQDAAAMVDMENEEYRRFVCIEPARIGPEQLGPGQRWEGSVRVCAVPA